MKTLATALFLCSFFFSSAQTMTEKYNSLMNRYEYFNSQGHMVGYKSYDSLMKQWNYYEVTQEQQPQNTYVEPINLDYVNKALSTKQAKLDANVARIDNAVNDIGIKIQNLEIDYSIKEIVMATFQNALKTINNKKLDYSNNNTTREVINYLYSQVNNEIAAQLKKQELKLATTNTASSSTASSSKISTTSTPKLSLGTLIKLAGTYTVKRYLINSYNTTSKHYDYKKMHEVPSEIRFKANSIEILNKDLSYKSTWSVESSDAYSYFLKDGHGNKLEIRMRDENKIDYFALKTSYKDGAYQEEIVYYFPQLKQVK
jgi:hypothetical protein